VKVDDNQRIQKLIGFFDQRISNLIFPDEIKEYISIALFQHILEKIMIIANFSVKSINDPKF